MSCSPLDLRDYFLGELAEDRRGSVEGHVRGCPACREELERLRVTEAALLTFRDEEVPQRIGFVSDKIFEPSPLRRWWQAFWGSAAKVGFVSAAMLSCAIVVHAVRSPAAPPPAPAATVAQAHVDVSKLQASFDQELRTAVQRAVADSEKRQDQKTAALVAELERRHQLDLKAVQLAAEENLDLIRKRFNVRYSASTDFGENQ